MEYFARIDGNLITEERKTYFYHTDHLGSTVLVTDELGQTVWSSEYTPFGQITKDDPGFNKAIKFTGKDLDLETGLYYFNARWYDSDIGRFISEDPIKDGLNWYTYAISNPLMYVDSTGLAAVFLLHGLNSGGEKEWGNMVSYLEATNDFITGGIIQGGTGFQNKKLFDSEDIVKIEKAIGVDFDKIKDTELLKPFIQAKVAELDEQGIDVLFMLDFTNNQGDFRNQGAELKKAIDLVNPKGHKANVLAHSMGSLGTASYISGISGVDYENDINTFIAIGAPFKGSSWAFAADLAGDFLPGDLRRHGTAYHNLRPDSKAINQLQKAWNNKSHNVNFHSLQCTAGDLVVSWNSSTSLKGGKNHGLTFTIHTRQTKNLDYQKATYQLLRNGTIEYNYTLKDLTWWERFRLNHLGPAYETMLWRLTR